MRGGERDGDAVGRSSDGAVIARLQRGAENYRRLRNKYPKRKEAVYCDVVDEKIA